MSRDHLEAITSCDWHLTTDSYCVYGVLLVFWTPHTRIHTGWDRISNSSWCPLHEAHEYTGCPLDSGQLLRAAKENYEDEALLPSNSLHIWLFCLFLFSLIILLSSCHFFFCVCPLSRLYFLFSPSLSGWVMCVWVYFHMCVFISQWAVCHTLTLTFSRAPAQIFTLSLTGMHTYINPS